MAKPKPPVFTVEPGRVLCRNGEPYALLGLPWAFFSRLWADLTAPGGQRPIGATQEQADKLLARIAFLLTEYGEDD